MGTIIKIKELGLQQLNNAEFTEFMNRFRKLIPVQESEEEERPGGLSVLTESGTGYLGVTSEMLAAFDADMQALTDSVSRQRTDDRTKQKSLYEVSRGSCVTLYFTSLQTAMKSPIAATAEAGNGQRIIEASNAFRSNRKRRRFADYSLIWPRRRIKRM